MTHNAAINKPVIDQITKDRLRKLKAEKRNGTSVLKDFAIFLDTHRDQPHVGGFFDDIHRGMCKPTKVDYLVEDDLLMNEAGQTLNRHDKHMFLTNEFFAQFVVDWMMANGTIPLDGDGCLQTSHFRDARAKVYEMKSFREIVRLRYLAQQEEKRGKS